MLKILQLTAAGLLVCALAKQPYDYYTLLRLAVCPATALSSYQAYKLNRTGWCWMLGISAFLFNPVFKVHLQRETWVVINITVALLLVYASFTISRQAKVKSEPETK